MKRKPVDIVTDLVTISSRLIEAIRPNLPVSHLLTYRNIISEGSELGRELRESKLGITENVAKMLVEFLELKTSEITRSQEWIGGHPSDQMIYDFDYMNALSSNIKRSLARFEELKAKRKKEQDEYNARIQARIKAKKEARL